MEEQLPQPEIETTTEPEPHERVINPPTKILQPSHHIKQFIAGVVAIVLLIIIGAIGYYLGQNNNTKPAATTSQGPTPTSTIIKVTVPVASVSATDKPIETAADSPLGDTIAVKPNKLTLTTDKTKYKKATDTIYITIANGLYQPIYAQDEQTNCKIVSLQYLEDTEWKPIDDCFLGRLPATIATGSQRGRVIKVHTKPLPPLPANDANTFKPGLYRIAFTYSLSINGPQFGGELIRPLTIYSPPFTIEL
jgi:hypothetical protein